MSLTGGDLRQLRGATFRADREAVRALLVGKDPAALLQHAGEALLAVGTDGLEDVARTVELGLRDRGETGDLELADALALRLGGPVPALRVLHVDLETVSELMLGEGGGWLDLATGEGWPEGVLDDLDEQVRPNPDDAPDRWLYVPYEASRLRWHDRRDFAGALPAGELPDRLLRALEGRGAFGRFSRVLDDAPEVLEDWRAYQSERQLGRARALLADEGYLALPRTQDAG